MIKIKYEIHILSSTIISPRVSQVRYLQGAEQQKIKKTEYLKAEGIKMIYPFYQYGEYDQEEYHPESTQYYLPGTSIKGAIRNNSRINNQLKWMVDDIKISPNRIVLRNLYKAQFLEKMSSKGNGIDVFFDKIGVEMLGANNRISGEIFTNDKLAIIEMLNNCYDITREKLAMMDRYLQAFCGGSKEVEDLDKVRKNILNLRENKDIILLGGYKGLIHSMQLPKIESEELKSAIFIDKETMLPHGLAILKIIED